METSIDDFELQYKRAFHHFNRMGPKVILYTFLKKKNCEKNSDLFLSLGVFSIN